MEFPQWAVPLRDNPEWRDSFNAWIDLVISIYENRALTAAKSMDELLGMRYAAGDMMALKRMINYQDEELERIRKNGMD